ncbi:MULTISPECIES: hypothetical protein [Okeania]|uniref:hypothetical protein n=1 Tax=Okeania TaxID=1458928 RepID=UPI00144BFC03|nr:MULTISPECIES: hypothetical protein [Okeania]NET76506.1 hypothetical protein [Okeania sp. SIO1F9]
MRKVYFLTEILFLDSNIDEDVQGIIIKLAKLIFDREWAVFHHFVAACIAHNN